MVDRPADQVHVLLAGRGRRSRSCCAAPTSPTATRHRRCCCAPRAALAALRHVRGVQPDASPPSGPTARPSTRPAPRSRQAGIGPDEVDVAQIQDTEAGAELMHMAETGLCEHGEQAELIEAGDTEIGGRLPINTDGGCIANGEPIGASGLRQVHESVLQLRGGAGDAPGARGAEGRVHPRLRGARDQRLHGDDAMSDDMTETPSARRSRPSGRARSSTGRAGAWLRASCPASGSRSTVSWSSRSSRTGSPT